MLCSLNIKLLLNLQAIKKHKSQINIIKIFVLKPGNSTGLKRNRYEKIFLDAP